jgi:ectoine hydroxylase-related dioxygenase (phytanoyl-CoA dioxygenase family)
MIENSIMERAITNMDEALAALGVSQDLLSADEKASIAADGYLILKDMIDPDWMAELRSTYEALMNEKYGKWHPNMVGGKESDFWFHEIGTRRLADIVSEGKAFDRIYTHPRLLAAVACILPGGFKFHSMNARDALPGQGNQGLHVDGEALKPNEPFFLVNTAWMLDAFTPENGPTRAVPGSHKIPGPIGDHVSDLLASHPRQQLVIAPAGSVLVFNGHVWHSGTTNRTTSTRRVIHCAFSSRSYPQYDCQAQRIRKGVYERTSPAARYILDV